MKHFFFLLTSFSLASMQAQITINSNHLPTDGDVLYARAATLLTDVNLEDSGPNHTWNFGFDVLEAGALNDGTECVGLDDLSLVDQIIFNNPFFNPDYDSDFGIGTAGFEGLPITIENAYQVYKNSGGVYAITGFVATVSGIPLASQYNDRDIIYDIPLTYPGSGNSHSVLALEVPTLAYYGTDQYRDYVVDGWGTINIYDQSFDVLRVKSHVTGFDTVSLTTDFLPFPIALQLPKDITTYQWISTEYKVPILEIISDAGGLGGGQLQVQTADIYQPTAIMESNSTGFSVFPNPTEQTLNVTQDGFIEIFNMQGQRVWSGNMTANQSLDVSSFNAGVYTITARQEESQSTVRFVKK
jgi:hypothetical protein